MRLPSAVSVLIAVTCLCAQMQGTQSKDAQIEAKGVPPRAAQANYQAQPPEAAAPKSKTRIGGGGGESEADVPPAEGEIPIEVQGVREASPPKGESYSAAAAWAAWAAVLAAFVAVWRQNRAAKRLVGVQLFLQIAAQWESVDFQRKRAQLARTLLADRQALEIDETALVFLETLAHMTGRGLLDRELVWNTFSFDVCSYWAAVIHYVRHVRERFSDPTLFEEMEALNKRFLDDGERLRHGETTSTIGLSDSAIGDFLLWESRRGEELVPAPTTRIISTTAG